MKKKLIAKVLPLICAIIFLIWFLRVFLNYVPFYLPSYCVWTGIAVTVFGIIGILLPFCRRYLFSRKRSAIILTLGVMMVVIPILWPVSIHSSKAPKQRLDDFLPTYQSTEYHEELAQVSFAKLEKAIFQVSMADMPAAVFLMKLRMFASGIKYIPNPTPILETSSGSAFMALDDSNPAERVFGMIGKPWKEETAPQITSPEEFIAFDEPGYVKTAFNFRLVDLGEKGVLISTETRSLGSDETAQNIFSRYWAVIYPGSSIIRRYWLRAIIRRAKSM